MSTVTGLFKDRAAAQGAFMKLEAAGILEDQISLVMTDDARSNHFRLKESSKVDEGTATGAGIGGLVGVILGTVLAAGTIAIPGMNLVVTGALVSSLAGLGAGAVVGGLVGGLVGAGIPEHEAQLYEKELQKGNVLIAVRAHNAEQEDVVKKVFKSLEAMGLAA